MTEINRQGSDFKKAKAFQRKYGNKYRLRPEMTGDDELIGYEILTCHHNTPECADYVVWEHSKTHFAAHLPSKSAKWIVKKFQDAKLDLETDEGGIILFPIEQIDDMAEDLRLRRKRRMTPEQKKKASERLQQHQFSPRRRASK